MLHTKVMYSEIEESGSTTLHSVLQGMHAD